MQPLPEPVPSPLRVVDSVQPGLETLEVIDQRLLPHRLQWLPLADAQAVFDAVRSMVVRGAPLIGAVAAFGLALHLRRQAHDAALAGGVAWLASARPTAVNLAWALQRVQRVVQTLPPAQRASAAWGQALSITAEDAHINARIGQHGLALLRTLAQQHGKGSAGKPLNVLTHCNAGWLATAGWGTATAPVYQAHAAGLHLHVWVGETRPRNQGVSLTAWELLQAGVPHTVVADNAGGHLMQHGQVDAVIVGCDRVSANGDVCNKVGTYLKALAAHDNGVPFYVAMPTPTLDLHTVDGVTGIEIEERSAREVTHLHGMAASGEVLEVRITPEGSAAANPAFDVTPARLVTALLTEHGVVAASTAAIARFAREHSLDRAAG